MRDDAHGEPDDQRAQIIAAAKCVFAERGINGTSLREIARRANVTTGAIYYYFENKNDLLIQVMSDTVHYIDRLSPTNEDGTQKDPRAFLKSIEDETKKRLCDVEWQKTHLVLAGEAATQSPDDVARHRKVYEAIIDHTAKYISPSLGTIESDKARMAACFIVAAIDGMSVQTSFGMHADDDDGMAEQFVEFFEAGLLAYLGVADDGKASDAD